MDIQEQVAAHAAEEGAEEIIATLATWLLTDQPRSPRGRRLTHDALMAAYAVRTLLHLVRQSREEAN